MGISIDEIKEHIFKLSFALDIQSAGKDYDGLRITHYDNQRWIHDNGLQEEYMQYFCKKAFGEGEDGNNN